MTHALQRRLAWFILALGALLPIAGVLRDPLTIVTGTPYSDVHKHVWSYWHALATPWSEWPHTPFLNATGGGVLLDLLFVPALLLSPLTAALGPAASANLWVWLNLWATGVATYALAREVGGPALSERGAVDADHAPKPDPCPGVGEPSAASGPAAKGEPAPGVLAAELGGSSLRTGGSVRGPRTGSSPVAGVWPALVAGLAAQTAPYMLGYPLASGVHERLMVWIFPLVILAILRCRAGSHPWRWTTLATVGYLVVALGCQAYALYTLVMILVGAPLWLIGSKPASDVDTLGQRAHDPRSGPGRPAPTGPPWLATPPAHREVDAPSPPTPDLRARALRAVARARGNARSLAPLALGLVFAGLAAWAHTRWLTESAWALVPRPDATLPVFGPAGQGQVATASATFAGLFDPFTVRASGARISGDQLYELVYLGWAPLGVAAYGAWRTRGLARGLFGLALAMVLLSVGPVFYAFDLRFIEPVSVAVSWVVPFYGTYPPLWQQAAAFAPLVAPAIAVGLGRAPVIVSALVFGVILLERALVSPVPVMVPTIRLNVPAVYDAIGEGAVVDIPRVIGRTPMAPGLYFLAQTRHEQPMAATINPGNSAWDAWLPVLRGVTSDWSAAATCLRRGGLRWVVIHRTWFDDTSLATRAATGLTRAVGPPVADDGDLAVFDIGEGGSPEPIPPPTTQAFELVKRGWIGQPATSLSGGEGCPVE